MVTGKGNGASAAFLKLLYQAVAWANVADNAGSSPLSNVYYGVNSSAPGADGNQSTNEADYPGYARQAVARTTGGHSVVGEIASPAAAITFPQSGGAGSALTHFHTGSALSGSGQIFHFGPTSAQVNISTGVAPQLSTDTTIEES